MKRVAILMKAFSLFFLLSALAPSDLLAHHGRDFLVTSSYKTPEQGDVFAVISTDYVRFTHHGDAGYELSPAVLYGLTDRWSIEVHSHHGIADGDVRLEMIAMESLIRLVSENAQHGEGDVPFSLALLAEYGKGVNEIPDAANARVVVGKEFGFSAAAVNVIVQKEFEENAHVELRFAAGLRTLVAPALGAGLELESSGDHNVGVMLTPGLYSSVAEHLDLRLGVSIGLEQRTLNALRTQAIYSF